MRRHGQRVVRVSTCGIHRSDLCDSGERSPGSSAEIRVRGTNWAYAARTQSRLCRAVGERSRDLGKRNVKGGIRDWALSGVPSKYLSGRQKAPDQMLGQCLSATS
jgi:hypothetical protein